VHEKVLGGYDVGQHPLVTRLLKGAFNDRPSLPKYTNTWDMQTAVDYIQSLGENSRLFPKQITWWSGLINRGKSSKEAGTKAESSRPEPLESPGPAVSELVIRAC
jgi:hypothetical protein